MNLYGVGLVYNRTPNFTTSVSFRFSFVFLYAFLMRVSVSVFFTVLIRPFVRVRVFVRVLVSTWHQVDAMAIARSKQQLKIHSLLTILHHFTSLLQPSSPPWSRHGGMDPSQYHEPITLPIRQRTMD